MYKKPGRLLRLLRRLRWLFTVYLPPRHIATTNTANGLLSFDSKDRSLGRQLCVYGEFEYPEMLHTVSQLKTLGYLPQQNGGRVMDVGGYIGMISVCFLKEGLFQKALTLEPNPNNFALLQRNVAQNKFTSMIDARNIAVSDSHSTLMMELSGKNFGDHRIRSSEHNETDHFNEENRTTIEIKAIPLDELYADEPQIFDDTRLVWMDIQGHEGKFFAGAKTFFAEHKGLPVVMEFWPYGLKRSGMDRDSFCNTVKSIFTTVYLLNEKLEKQPIQNIDAIYYKYDHPEKGAHLLLINE